LANRSVQAATTTLVEDRDFLTIAFDEYWITHRAQEPTKYFSFREAVQFLYNFTGMNRYGLAAYLGVTSGYLGIIESSNRKIPRLHFTRLRLLAESYTLPVLVDFFKSCEDAAAMRAPAKGKKGAGKANTPDWRDMIGV
jgi:hypothetical protein